MEIMEFLHCNQLISLKPQKVMLQKYLLHFSKKVRIKKKRIMMTKVKQKAYQNQVQNWILIQNKVIKVMKMRIKKNYFKTIKKIK